MPWDPISDKPRDEDEPGSVTQNGDGVTSDDEAVEPLEEDLGE
jgi:hypothetical protein